MPRSLLADARSLNLLATHSCASDKEDRPCGRWDSSRSGSSGRPRAARSCRPPSIAPTRRSRRMSPGSSRTRRSGRTARRAPSAATAHFVGAEARGTQLSYLYEVNVNPRAVNTAAMREEFYRKAIPLACKSDTALRRALIQGASIEYAYRTSHTKQHLFAVQLNGGACRA